MDSRIQHHLERIANAQEFLLKIATEQHEMAKERQELLKTMARSSEVSEAMLQHTLGGDKSPLS